jgi:hypothetical protein
MRAPFRERMARAGPGASRRPAGVEHAPSRRHGQTAGDGTHTAGGTVDRLTLVEKIWAGAGGRMVGR